MMPRARCTSGFTERDYQRYVQLRDAVRVRRSGIGLAALGVLFAVAGIVIAVDGVTGTALSCIAVGVVLAAAGAYVVATGKTLGGGALHAGDARSFLSRHGAVGDPPRFRQTVAFDDEGITLSYGAPGAHPQQVTTERFAWSDWKRVVLEPDVLFIERDTHQGGLSDLFGFNYLIRMAERDGFDDVYAPVSDIEGMAPADLAAFAEAMIARAHARKGRVQR